MKKLVGLFAVVLLSSVSSYGDIIVTEVHSSGSGNTTYAADWFELTNNGPTSVDITGWSIDDSSNSTLTAATLTGVTAINPGQSVIFAESDSPVTLIPAFTLAWFGPNIPAGFTIGTYTGSGLGLSTGALGDAVNIFNSTGTPIANVSFGPASTGITFDNTAGAAGLITTLSSPGVNGAFTSFTGNEVGSPGVGISAVPEPSSIALLALCGGGLGIIVRLRRSKAKLLAVV